MFDYKGLKTWSDEEWNRLPREDRPGGAIRFGLGWACLTGDSPIRPEDTPTGKRKATQITRRAT